MPRFPIISTIIVACCCLTMIGLGVWQLGRGGEKDAMIARYQSAGSMDAEVAWPRSRQEIDAALYRRSTLPCEEVLSIRSTAGRSQSGRAGWAHIARCALQGGGEAELALGWSREANAPEWRAAPVAGLIAPAKDDARLIAAESQAGLEPLANPDPNDLPNNHLAYAGQWFFFALTALVIFVLALRGKDKALRGNKGSE